MFMNVFASSGSGNATPFRPAAGEREPGGATRNGRRRDTARTTSRNVSARSGRTGLTRN